MNARAERRGNNIMGIAYNSFITKGAPSNQDYTMNVYKNGVFIVAYHFPHYSGQEMAEEVSEWRKIFPESLGFKLIW